MSAHILDLQFQLRLIPGLGALESMVERGVRTLNARCSRKWAEPEVASVSAREPASIQIPSVAVWR
jgi:hypothetical protein